MKIDMKKINEQIVVLDNEIKNIQIKSDAKISEIKKKINKLLNKKNNFILSLFDDCDIENIDLDHIKKAIMFAINGENNVE